MKNSTIYSLISSIVFLAVCLYGVFYITSAIKSEIAIIQVHRSKEMQNKNYEFGNRLRDNLKTLLEQEAKIKDSFILASNMVDFIQVLEDSAKTQGLKISISSVDQGESVVVGETVGKVGPVTFNVQTEGTYEQTRLFINDLLRFEKNISITSISIFRTASGEYTARIAIAGIILSYE